MKLYQSDFNKATSRNISIFSSILFKCLCKAVTEKVIADKLYTNIF